MYFHVGIFFRGVLRVLFRIETNESVFTFTAVQIIDGCFFRQGSTSIVAFGVTFFILLLQAATLCAAGTMFSVVFQNQALAAISTMLLCGGLPTGAYLAILAWSPSLRAGLAWMPSLVHVYDFSTGLFSSAVITLYTTITILLLFISSKALACLRLRN